MNIENTLAYKLGQYTSAGIYPMHMPGHKRRPPQAISKLMEDIHSIDLTEVYGSDSLHEANGIIYEAMSYAANEYGADRSYFLVNGSTCGVLAAIRGCMKNGGRLLMASNAHISAYHAIELMNIKTDYIKPEAAEGYGMAVSVDMEGLRAAMKPDTSAIYITSPSYEGVISDIEMAARLAHSRGIPLIVDEAHGAHLHFLNKYCPELGIRSAIELGADIVIQSTHKTLPALTQTALLHVKGELADIYELESAISIFETTSPSYILMSSIDLALRYMSEDGREPVLKYIEEIRKFRQCTEKLKNIKIWNPSDDRRVFLYDEGKLVISAANMSGRNIQDVLRAGYGIETEMAARSYALAMSSVSDSSEGYMKLADALSDMDKRIARGESFAYNRKEEEELRARLEAVRGLKSRGYIYAYPPGIPIVLPGGTVDKEAYSVIDDYIRNGCHISGI